jgi:hypothetical protein
LAIFPKQVSAQAAEALVRFNDSIVHDVDSNLLTFYTYTRKDNPEDGLLQQLLLKPRSSSFEVPVPRWSANDVLQPDFRDVIVVAMYGQVAGVPRAPSYTEWLALPEVATTYKQTSIPEMAAEYNLPTGY